MVVDDGRSDDDDGLDDVRSWKSMAGRRRSVLVDAIAVWAEVSEVGDERRYGTMMMGGGAVLMVRVMLMPTMGGEDVKLTGLIQLAEKKKKKK